MLGMTQWPPMIPGKYFTDGKNLTSSQNDAISSYSWPSRSQYRSEERRVGKECRTREGPCRCKKKEEMRVDVCVFFFQAEDGIRDKLVTGVQTCALPILSMSE